MVDDGIFISIGDLRQVLLEWFSLTDFNSVKTFATNDIVTMCFSRISGSNYPIGEEYKTIRQTDEMAAREKREGTRGNQTS